jgi:hypothetical protein
MRLLCVDVCVVLLLAGRRGFMGVLLRFHPVMAASAAAALKFS